MSVAYNLHPLTLLHISCYLRQTRHISKVCHLCIRITSLTKACDVVPAGKHDEDPQRWHPPGGGRPDQRPERWPGALRWPQHRRSDLQTARARQRRRIRAHHPRRRSQRYVKQRARKELHPSCLCVISACYTQNPRHTPNELGNWAAPTCIGAPNDPCWLIQFHLLKPRGDQFCMLLTRWPREPCSLSGGIDSGSCSVSRFRDEF